MNAIKDEKNLEHKNNKNEKKLFTKNSSKPKCFSQIKNKKMKNLNSNRYIKT